MVSWYASDHHRDEARRVYAPFDDESLLEHGQRMHELGIHPRSKAAALWTLEAIRRGMVFDKPTERIRVRVEVLR